MILNFFGLGTLWKMSMCCFYFYVHLYIQYKSTREGTSLLEAKKKKWQALCILRGREKISLSP